MAKEYDMRLLRNFYISERDGSVIYLKNSCGPDSLIQCLTACCKDSNLFRNTLMTGGLKDRPLVKFLEFFSQNGDFDEVNFKRNDLYRKHFSSSYEASMETIDCLGSIFTTLTKLVTPTLPSTISVMQCDCGRNSKKFPLIDINYRILANIGMNNLQKAMQTVAQNMSWM